jgi:hypothetical protein
MIDLAIRKFVRRVADCGVIAFSINALPAKGKGGHICGRPFHVMPCSNGAPLYCPE